MAGPYRKNDNKFIEKNLRTEMEGVKQRGQWRKFLQIWVLEIEKLMLGIEQNGKVF